MMRQLLCDLTNKGVGYRFRQHFPKMPEHRRWGNQDEPPKCLLLEGFVQLLRNCSGEDRLLEGMGIGSRLDGGTARAHARKRAAWTIGLQGPREAALVSRLERHLRYGDDGAGSISAFPYLRMPAVDDNNPCPGNSVSHDFSVLQGA